jgi:hypothetical protein
MKRIIPRFQAKVLWLSLILGWSFVQPLSAGQPKFEDFPVFKTYSGRPGVIRFTANSSFKRFRSKLSEGIKQGVNFAGEFTIITWGCGTFCSQNVIVHAQTGRIVGSFQTCGGEAYKKDSRLLILNPSQEDNQRVEYPGMCNLDEPYVWNGEKLIPLKANTQ